MPTATPNFGSPVTMTLSLASLASDTNLLAGRESTVVDNGPSGDDAIDAIIGGLITTGTSPTADRQIEVWAYGTWDGGSRYSHVCTGTDGNLTLVKKSLLRLVTIIPTSATSNYGYQWGPVSMARVFDGILPQKWGLWVVQNTGVALNSTAGNHEVKYTPLKIES